MKNWNFSPCSLVPVEKSNDFNQNSSDVHLGGGFNLIWTDMQVVWMGFDFFVMRCIVPACNKLTVKFLKMVTIFYSFDFRFGDGVFCNMEFKTF